MLDTPEQSPVLPPKEQEPPSYKPLEIRNDHPENIYNAIKKIAKSDSANNNRIIGFDKSSDPGSPLAEVDTMLSAISRNNLDLFNISTEYYFGKSIYLSNDQVQTIMDSLQNQGYNPNLQNIDTNSRFISIPTPEGNFALYVGWQNKEEYIAFLDRLIERTHFNVRWQDRKKEALAGQDKNYVNLKLRSSDNDGFDYVTNESEEKTLRILECARKLGEDVATSITHAIDPNYKGQTMHVDWLPPELVESMETHDNTSVEGKVEPTQLVESSVKESRGLERLVGLSQTTRTELERIIKRLKDPERAAFMKKHNMRVSSGAIFFGLPGTGKSLAGQAVAEESGCQHDILKIDEYMTSYMHDSARKLGEKLRKLKQMATQDKPLIIQIDEADTILKPIGGGLDSPLERDAAEIRSVLLREFQEPSNVFYILTTNLNPRDPHQADPAIVRNERLGYLVPFMYPDVQGRHDIFSHEVDLRSMEDLHWSNLNFGMLAEQSENFSPADIQAVLSVAAELGYDEEARPVTVTQEHMEKALDIVRSRMQTIINKQPAIEGFIEGRNGNGSNHTQLGKHLRH